MSIDPLATATPTMSPYVGMNNNPVSVVDPLGLIGEILPGHNSNTPQFANEFLSRVSEGYRKGLAGDAFDADAWFKGINQEAIARQHVYDRNDAWSELLGDAGGEGGAMSLTQGYSNVTTNDESSSADASSVCEEGDNGEKTPMGPFTPAEDNGGEIPEAARWDLNGDGKLSLSEAKNWREKGLGKSIEVDASKIDIGYIDTKDMKKDQLISINFIGQASVAGTTGIVYGQLDLKYNGAGGFSINPNMYDFETGEDTGHPWSGQFIRNSLTAAGRVYNGWNGADYMINFRGTATPSAPHFLWDNPGAIKFPGQ